MGGVLPDESVKKQEEKKAYEPKALKKVQVIAQSYYARKDVQEALYEFCKHRETIPRYLEFFGKRPDCFDYAQDIATYAKNGATSFHCSEELWGNPLDIQTSMTPREYNEIRIGWDMLIDIDSPYLDYSKIAAKLLLKALREHGVKNYGVKFSGSKGFHIIVPYKAFPQEISEELTKHHFPDWARAIAGYLNELVQKELTEEILKLTTQKELDDKGAEVHKTICKTCKNEAVKKQIGKYVCPNFRCKAEVNSMKSNRKQMICPSCNGSMNRVDFTEVLSCEHCNIHSSTRPDNFEETTDVGGLIETVDIVLVAPRHLFRSPYSLHEKTALASIVVQEEDIDSFKPSDADPLKITQVQDFMPAKGANEGKDLLLQALDWMEKKGEPTKKYDGEGIDLQGLTITEDMYPPVIQKILEGIKDDGRKRALGLLLAFFYSLNMPDDYILETIYIWNEKNYHPLKEGYIRSQINWYKTNKRLPPNYDKPIYKEFGIQGPPEPGMKNPINYTIKQAMRRAARRGPSTGTLGKKDERQSTRTE